MKNTSFFPTLFVFTFLFVGCSNNAKDKTENRPNIILIMADDLGYETLACNGGISYNTPVLDQMAENGIRFTNCYSQPLCTPSRVKIMTGKFNFRNYEHFEYLNPSQLTFGNVLKAAGYKTAIAGKWQLNGRNSNMPGNQDVNRPNEFGFDEYCLWQVHRPKKEGERYANPLIFRNGEKVDGLKDSYGPDIFSDFVLQFIEKNLENPFFVYYPMVLTHDPFVPTPNSVDWEDASKRYKQDEKYFKDMVEYVDEIVGRIENKLKENNILDNTIIIFTGDNGTNTKIISQTNQGNIKGGKGLSINTGNHVPLIIQWPSVIKESRVSDALIDFADFMPTLADFSGYPKDSLEVDGRSFFTIINGDKQTFQDEVFIHYSPRWGKSKHNRWVMNGKYKMYRDFSFYNTGNDLLEKIPLQKLNDEERTIHDKFVTILNDKENEFPFDWNDKSFTPPSLQKE